jgi:hypothetical protein
MQRTLRAALGKSRWRADWVKWTLCLLLQTATLNDRCEVVRTLIKLGADLEIKDAQVGVSQIGLSSSIQHTHTHLARCIRKCEQASRLKGRRRRAAAPAEG